MKHVLIGLVILWLALGLAAQTAGPNEQYVRVYQLIQQADELNQTGQGRGAKPLYQEAQTALKNLQLAYPAWNTNVVQFRLNYLAKKLDSLTATSLEMPIPPVAPPPTLAEKPASPPAPVTLSPTSPPVRLETTFSLPSPGLAPLKTNSAPANSSFALAEKDNQIHALMDMVSQLGADKAVLEAKLRAGLVNPSASLNSQELAQAEQRIRFLQKENDLLKVSLQQDQDRISQLSSLQARLDILEARRIPFTTAELALFKAPQPALETARPPADKPAAPAVQSHSGGLAVGAGSLASDAEKAFASRRFAEAEQKYRQMLKANENSVFVLGNLAATQLELGRLDAAESNLKRALALEPDDAFNLSLWGVLKFRQGQYDAAFVALSRSAQLNPDRAETQNYLGITLSQKGQREAAETAFRKAVQLAPNYANAHYNLALIYALQNPPLLSLAKYHYEKALALGQSKNFVLERIIDKRGF